MTFRCKDLPVFHALNDGQAKGIVSISMQGRGTGATKGIERNDDRTAHAAWSRGRRRAHRGRSDSDARSEEHTSELQSLMRTSYAVSCLKEKTNVPIAQAKIENHTKHHNPV